MDPEADEEEVEKLYKLRLYKIRELKGADAIIVAVGHDIFLKYGKNDYKEMYSAEIKTHILFDLKGIYKKSEYSYPEWDYWRL